MSEGHTGLFLLLNFPLSSFPPSSSPPPSLPVAPLSCPGRLHGRRTSVTAALYTDLLALAVHGFNCPRAEWRTAFQLPTRRMAYGFCALMSLSNSKAQLSQIPQLRTGAPRPFVVQFSVNDSVAI